MNKICRFTVPASRDIEDIIDYIADNRNFNAAERLLRKINNKCERLANFPSMGRRRKVCFRNRIMRSPHLRLIMIAVHLYLSNFLLS